MPSTPSYKPLEIEVTDFGPIAKAKLDLRPLTVFVGPSNTGKSYLAMLIYALHRILGSQVHSSWPSRRFRSFLSSRRRRKKDELSESEVRALFDCGIDIAQRASGKEATAPFRLQIPEAVAEIIRPELSNTDNLFGQLERKIERCFGVEDTATLNRIGGSRAWQVSLARQKSGSNGNDAPLAYRFTMYGDARRSVTTWPESAPLIIGETVVNRSAIESFTELHWFDSKSKEDNELLRMRQAEEVLYHLTEVVGSSILNPLNRVAHYLPADRAGVMHAHRVVVASLIRLSSLAALQREEPLPALSGVLADFLEQLVGIGDLSKYRRKDNWALPGILERDILNGRVREEQSATGYPIFSYQPASSKQDIPLMRASSMVSELAPVVLYLRHLVQPGDVLIIEEPESHLHPAMQAAFTRQLAAVVRAGVRVMITTHSDYVLEELANLVRMSELPETQQAALQGAEFALREEDVGVWLFEPKKRPKGSVVKEVLLDKDAGLYSAGYSDVSAALYNMSVAIDNRIGESRTD